MRSAFLNAVTEVDVAAVARSPRDEDPSRRRGSCAAVPVLRRGEAGPVVDPDTLDLGEFGILLRYPADVLVQQAIMEGVRLAVELAGLKEESFLRYPGFPAGERRADRGRIRRDHGTTKRTNGRSEIGRVGGLPCYPSGDPEGRMIPSFAACGRVPN